MAKVAFLSFSTYICREIYVCVFICIYIYTYIYWGRQWHPTPVLLPGKSHGWRSLVGCSPWGSWRVRHDWVTSLSLFTFMHWRRKWQPTPVFLPGESQGQGAWWAAIYAVAQSQTWLKRLSSSSSIHTHTHTHTHTPTHNSIYIYIYIYTHTHTTVNLIAKNEGW